MSISNHIYRCIALIRRKTRKYSLRYQWRELNSLMPGRVISPPGGVAVEEFPVFYLDDSASKVIFGEGVSIRGRLSLLAIDNSRISIGCNTFFNQGCSLNALLAIYIGNDCMFGEHVKIYDHNHKYADKKTLMKDQGYTLGEVKIGNNCWIGSNTIILKGVTIGDNSVIGANSVIYKSLPADSLFVNQVRSEIA